MARPCATCASPSTTAQNKDTGDRGATAPTSSRQRLRRPGRTLRQVPGQGPSGGNRRSPALANPGDTRTAASTRPSRWSPRMCSSSALARRAGTASVATRRSSSRTVPGDDDIPFYPPTTGIMSHSHKDSRGAGKASWANRIVSHGEEAPGGELSPTTPTGGLHTPDPAPGPGELSSARSASCSAVVVNTTTGRLIDGHLRVELAKARASPRCPVVYVELTEDEERLVLATPRSDRRHGRRPTAASWPSCCGSIESPRRAGARPARGRSPASSASSCRQRRSRSTPTRCPRRPTEPISRLGDLWLLGATQAALWRFHQPERA